MAYEEIEEFLSDLFGRRYMQVPEEDVPEYHAKVKKFVDKQVNKKV